MLTADIAEYLDSLGIVTYDASGVTGNVFMDTLPPTPDLAVGVYTSGGRRPAVRNAVDYPNVQLIVRGTRDPRGAHELARDIFDAFMPARGFDRTELVAGGAVVLSARAVQSEPVHIGVDENGRHRYSVNIELTVERG